METGSLLSAYYRMRFDDALSNRISESARVRQSSLAQNVLFSDVVTLKNVRNVQLPAIDPGEHKQHFSTPSAQNQQLDDISTVLPVNSMQKPLGAEYALLYRANSKLDSADSRRQIEDRVRRLKRAGAACPFRDDEGQCSMMYVRCGDRLQFSLRETGRERAFFHRCTYDWRSRGAHVLVVDDSPAMQDFCKSSFSLFMNYDPNKIFTAGSVDQAIDILSRSKVNGLKIGLVFIDIVMPGKSGYDLVEELYYRNYETEILLMRGEHEDMPLPEGYHGSSEILPNVPFVSGVLIKPFHSETLVHQIKQMKFGW